MKLRLHWAEKYEVVREYPSFEIDSEEFPELELEMLNVYNASTTTERNIALADFAGFCASRAPRDLQFEEFLSIHTTPYIRERAHVISQICPTRVPPVGWCSK